MSLAQPPRKVLLRALRERGHAATDRADVVQEPIGGEPGPCFGHESEQSQVVLPSQRGIEEDTQLLLKDGPQERPARVRVIGHDGPDVLLVLVHLRGGDQPDALPLLADAPPRRQLSNACRPALHAGRFP